MHFIQSNLLSEKLIQLKTLILQFIERVSKFRIIKYTAVLCQFDRNYYLSPVEHF